MFKLLLYTTLLNLTVSVSSFAQTSTLESKPHFDQTEVDRLLKKSKNQKITAWSMLAGGSVLSIIGLTQLNFAGSSTGEVNNTPGTVLFLAGAATALGSIHFFSAAKKNRRKAMSVSFKTLPIPQLPKNNYQVKAIPSLNLNISL